MQTQLILTANSHHFAHACRHTLERNHIKMCNCMPMHVRSHKNKCQHGNEHAHVV